MFSIKDIWRSLMNENEEVKTEAAADTIPDTSQAVFTSSGTTITLPIGASSGAMTTFSSLFDSMIKPLSTDEVKRLEELKQEHQVKIKQAKVDIFKKHPPDMRQFVINVISWRDLAKQVEAVSIDTPQELKDLEQRHEYGKLFTASGRGFQYHIRDNTASIYDILISLGSFDGLTFEDLKQAHLEATMEEEMLNGGQES